METPSKPPRFRRPWSNRKAILLVTGGVLLFGVLRLYYPPDEPPLDPGEFPDLTLAPSEPADDQSSDALLAKAGALLSKQVIDDSGQGKIYHMVAVGWEEDQARQRRDEPPPPHQAGDLGWDADQARQWLDGTDAIWSLWDQAARSTQNQSRRDDEDTYWDHDDVLTLAHLAQVRVGSLAHGGRGDEALAVSLTNLRVTERLEETRWYFGGMTLKFYELKFLPALVRQAGVTNAGLRQILQGLEGIRPARAAAVFFIENLERNLNQNLDAMRKWSLFGPRSMFSEHLHMLAPDPTPWYQWVGLKLPLLFKPNQTRRLYAETLHQAIGAIDQDWAQVSCLDRDWQEKVVRAGLLHLSLDNLFGRIVMSQLDPFSRFGILSIRLEEQSRISAAQAFLALLLFHRDHGALPATLDELVPAYLPAVPRDYFSGQPIGYSHDYRALWSVGMDHFTVTQTKLGWVDDHTIYLPLDFAAPANPGSAGGPPAL